ncbi:MAG: hypothetical protein Q9165_006028 [Trypethelium subeluteriae]
MSTELPDLQAAWLDACAEFKKATGFDLTIKAKDRSSDGRGIVDRFDAAKAKDAESRQNMNKAKTAVDNTLKAIERIGTVAAQGVSMVFGSPATITMDCISFLIDAGSEYKNIALNIADLFSRIATTMERFQIYQESEKIMDSAMILVAHRVLMAVVSICGLCIKITHRNGLRKFLSVALFSSDGGIKDQLNRLRLLEWQELQMKGTLTYVATETNKRNIHSGFEEIKATESKIANSVSQLNASSTDQKALNELKEKLGVDDQSSKEEFRASQDKLVSGTCSWLQDDPQYQMWTSEDKSEGSILILGGEEGCGKSYALSAINRDLVERHPQCRHDVSRVSVAYYYLTRVGRKDTQNMKSGPSMKDALRSWVWQIVNNDLFYRKDIEAIFRNSSDLGDLNECWQKLILKHLDKEVTFFLLLDGTHELDDKGISNLVTLLKALPKNLDVSGRLRIAITARPPLVQRLDSQISMRFPIINLRDRNSSDIGNYIREKADNLAIFQKQTLEVQKLKGRVCSGLVEAVDGSFLLADIKLREIGSKYDSEEVMRIIERTKKQGANLDDSIVADIRQCNRTLNAREIQNLNTLLLWIIYAEWGFQIYELESILFIEQGKSSLQPLASDIRDKFFAFFELGHERDERNATVTLRHDSIADFFKNITERRQSPDAMVPQTLTKGEIRMVQHFIQKLCEQEMYDMLGLGEFFDQKLSQSDTSVIVDCENAQAKMALGCLRVLTEDLPQEAGSLKPYAKNHLYTHLKQVDLDSTHPHLKAELGPRLVKVLTDRATIRRSEVNPRNALSYNDDGVREILRLFRSSVVMKAITASDDESREWVNAALSHTRPEIALLGDVVKIKAELWLAAEWADDVIQHFLWVYGYYNKVGLVTFARRSGLMREKVKTGENPNLERVQSPPSTEEIDKNEIYAIWEMVQDMECLKEPNPTTLRNLGVTYRECKHIPESIVEFNRALAMDADCLLARTSLGRAYAQQSKGGPKPDWEKAMYHYDIAIQSVASGNQIFAERDPEEELKSLLQEKATWLRQLSHFDEARHIYNDLLKKNPEDDEIRLEFVYMLCEAQRFDEVVGMFQALRREIEPETQRSNLSRFFCSIGSKPAYHTAIRKAFRAVGNMLEIKNHYRLAIDDASKDKEKQEGGTSDTYCDLSYYFAVLIYSHGDSARERDEATQLWERIVTIAKTEGDVHGLQIFSARRLAKIYIAKAVAGGRDSDVAREMLKKLQSLTLALNSVSGEGSDDEYWNTGISRAQVRSLLGRYYSGLGEAEKAREQLRPDVEVAMKLLSDEDPDNDYQGYRKLGDALMDFGDDPNAVASWCLIQPLEGLAHYGITSAPVTDAQGTSDSGSNIGAQSELDSSLIEPARMGEDTGGTSQPAPLQSSSTSNPAQRLTGPLHYSCDGQCGRKWTYADDLYICRECIDVQFDAPCVEKLCRGELEWDICDRNHAFMHVPAWNVESAKRAQEGKVLIDGEICKIDAWLESIKQEWGLKI